MPPTVSKIALLSAIQDFAETDGQFAFGAFGSLNTYGVTKEVLAAYILAQVGNDIVAGSDQQVQFNQAGGFGASSGLTFDYNTGNLSVGGNIFATLVNGVDLVANGAGDGWLDNAGNYTVPVSAPGGANFNVQFNDNGVIEGDNNFNWNKNTATLTVSGYITGLFAPVLATDATNKSYVDGIQAALQAGIDQNASDIAQNASDIAQNTSDILQNSTDISQNATDIQQNATAISQNTSDIAQNSADVASRILLSEKGAANGVATLDGGGVIPISQIPSSVIGGIKVIGFWDADTNTPDLSALTLEQGQAYMVSVGGNTNLNGETNWLPKDLAVWDDNLAGNYFKQDNTDDVLSVAGKTGVVVLEAADITDFDTEVSNNPTVVQNESDIDDLEATRLQSVVAGEGVSVDASDPLNPIVSIFTPKIVRSDAISTNTTTVPLSKLAHTFTNVPAGDYEIVFKASHSYDAINSSIVIQAEIDSVLQGTSDEVLRLEPKDAGGDDGDGRATDQKDIFSQSYPHTQVSLGSVDAELLFFSSVAAEISALWGVSIELKAVTNV